MEAEFVGDPESIERAGPITEAVINLVVDSGQPPVFGLSAVAAALGALIGMSSPSRSAVSYNVQEILDSVRANAMINYAINHPDEERTEQ